MTRVNKVQWRVTTLGDEFRWASGGTPRATNPRFYDGGIPWAVIGDLNDSVVESTKRTISEDGLRNSSAKWVDAGSVLVAMYGSIGKLGIAGTRLTTNQAIAFTKPETCSPKFLFWYLRHARPSLIRLGKGGTQSNISQAVLKAFPFSLPTRPEQDRVVDEIELQSGRLDVADVALRRAQANLRRYRAAVLKAACEGRLVPTEAELARETGRPGDYESGEALLARILEERRRSWKGKGKYKEPAGPDVSQLPALPEGWVWSQVDLLGEVQLGRQRAPKHHRGPNMRPYLRVANVYEDRLALDDVKEMNFTPDEFEVFHLEPGDILLNEGQSLELVGRPAIFRGEIPGACFTNTLVRFRPSRMIDVKFALSAFRYFLHSGRFRRIARWTTNIAHLGANRFAQMAFPLPSRSEQARIAAEVECRLSMAESLDGAIATCLGRAGRLRQETLRRAFGEPPRWKGQGR